MAPPILNLEPVSLNAGDTAKWRKSLLDYPANDGWQLAYTLINAAGKIEFSASPDGADHLVNVDATTTASWASGDYAWRATASKGGDVFTVGSGRMWINPSFTGDSLETRSQARRTLEAIEATLEGRASSATAEYQIAGRQLKYIPIPELLQLRDRFRADVRSEDAAALAAAGLPRPGRVYVRFGP